ncbi:unnamed protein product [Soboliphyme baturini]|uniref:tRNA (guanine(26)-N(2))-dimethyltransferase n=1 Tax=Soboliphyme baturini TaxID=241478 RepID=A0A183IXF4_9BILA|nr:unnamed protein product [Soboliphyme baturini]
MHNHKNVNDNFHVIDLDPYGSAAHFLDAAVQSVADGGLLMVTCTDVAVLCGNTPEACFSKYGSVSLKCHCCHEMAIRILLRCIDSHALCYGRYIEPLLSISVDFYIRVFVLLHYSPFMAKESCRKSGMVYQCTGCESLVIQPMARRVKTKKGGMKYVPAMSFSGSHECEICGFKNHVGGPIWTDPIHDLTFVKKMVSTLEEFEQAGYNLGTKKRIVGLLNVIMEELHDVPLYYSLSRMASIIHCKTPPQLVLRSAILNSGFRVSVSHAYANSVKTDMPNAELWDVFRCWANKESANSKHLPESSPGHVIMSREVK